VPGRVVEEAKNERALAVSAPEATALPAHFLNKVSANVLTLAYVHALLVEAVIVKLLGYLLSKRNGWHY
jgi:hypothetical protein